MKQNKKKNAEEKSRISMIVHSDKPHECLFEELEEMLKRWK